MSSDHAPTPPDLLKVEEPLRNFTETARKPLGIEWYRTPLPPGAMKKLHTRSDFLGAVQTLGFLVCLAVPATIAIRGGLRGEWG